MGLTFTVQYDRVKIFFISGNRSVQTDLARCAKVTRFEIATTLKYP